MYNITNKDLHNDYNTPPRPLNWIGQKAEILIFCKFFLFFSFGSFCGFLIILSLNRACVVVFIFEARTAGNLKINCMRTANPCEKVISIFACNYLTSKKSSYVLCLLRVLEF